MPKRRRWGPTPNPCWCCRRAGKRPAIAAEAEGRRVAYICQGCAATEPLVREFATRQLAAHEGKALTFRRLPFIRRTVFDLIFAAYPYTAEEGSVAVVISGTLQPAPDAS